MNLKNLVAFINYPGLSPILTLHPVLGMLNRWVFFFCGISFSICRLLWRLHVLV